MVVPLFAMKKSSGGKKKSLTNLVFNRVIPLLFIIFFLTAVYVAYSYTQNTVWNTKTVAGDNLNPTPWHLFHKTQDNSKARARRILQCNYLSCSFQFPRLYIQKSAQSSNGSEKCPDFFHWIHEDLSPWKQKGISRSDVERARSFAAFRVVIKGGKLYTDLYYICVQTRMMFTLWGLLLLLERFPGEVPDVDLMFNCMDRPHFFKHEFKQSVPPPLFAYCGSRNSYEIPFPDWSYWGWSEVNIGPWNEESASIFEGSKKTSWIDRQPRAYWKGNPHVGAKVRTDLLTCNKNDQQDFGADVYVQNWNAEAKQGYKNSKLSNQCQHRYKIYAEGYAWSVSFKYIMACGSTLLTIDPEYTDFFMRGLLPQNHYWPIDRRNLCPAINHAVKWGNSHPSEAEAIGTHAQQFLRDDLSMDHVYDYMLHLLKEYSKLLTFQPTVPQGAQLLCKNAVLCIADPVQKQFLERSLNHNLHPAVPCSMPPADDGYIAKFREEEQRGFRRVKEMVSNSTRIRRTQDIVTSRISLVKGTKIVTKQQVKSSKQQSKSTKRGKKIM